MSLTLLNFPPALPVGDGDSRFVDVDGTQVVFAGLIDDDMTWESGQEVRDIICAHLLELTLETRTIGSAGSRIWVDTHELVGPKGEEQPRMWYIYRREPGWTLDINEALTLLPYVNRVYPEVGITTVAHHHERYGLGEVFQTPPAVSEGVEIGPPDFRAVTAARVFLGGAIDGLTYPNWQVTVYDRRTVDCNTLEEKRAATGHVLAFALSLALANAFCR